MAEIPLAILISGGGTTAEAVIKATQNDGVLRGKVRVVDVISNTSMAGGLKKATDLGIRTCVIDPEKLSAEAFEDKLLKRLDKFGSVGVAQLGWLQLTPGRVVNAFSKEGRFITNNHPGALDVTHRDQRGRRLDFGGGPMRGSRVVCAQIAYNWMIGENDFVEASVHHVSPIFDEGSMIRVMKMKFDALSNPVSFQQLMEDRDLLEDITRDVQHRLLYLEHLNTIHALEDIADGNFPSYKRDEFLVPEENADILYQARRFSVKLFPEG